MTYRPKNLYLAAFLTLLAINPARLVNGEEASILDGATVPTTALKLESTPVGDVILTGSYKSYIYRPDILAPDPINPIDIAVVALK